MFFKHNLSKKQGFYDLIIDFLSSNCHFKKFVGTAIQRTLDPPRDAMLEIKRVTAADTENAVYTKYRPLYDTPNINPLAATSNLADRAKMRNVHRNG